jgi:hypothetical protein
MNIHNFFMGRIIGIVVVIVLAGGGYAIYRGMQAAMPASQDSQTSTSTPQEAGTFTGSVADLSARGGDWKCTVDTKASAGATAASGVVYVSGTRIRADYHSTVQGVGAVEAHLIADGTSVYSWSSMLPQGIKTEMSASQDESISALGDGANQSYTYDCDPAHADASLFVPPSNISFRTL